MSNVRNNFGSRIQSLVLLAVLAMVQGCGKKPSAATNNQPAEIRIGYFANLTHAQAVLGIASGEFERAVAPVRVTTKVFNAGPSLIEALFAGEIDIGYVGPGPALSGFEKSRGEGLRVLAGAAANGVVIVARPDSGINTMADLAGKRIATPQMGNTQDIAARHYLISELKQPNADNILPVNNAEQLAMMSRGQIDAAWAPEPWGARLVTEANAKIIAEEKDLWPKKEFVLTVVVADPNFAANHTGLVEKILRTHASLTARLQSNPESMLPQLEEAMQSLTGKKLSHPVMQQAIGRIRFTNEPMSETFRTMAQWSFDLGFSRNKPDLSKMIDTRILDRIGAAKDSTSPAGVKP